MTAMAMGMKELIAKKSAYLAGGRENALLANEFASDSVKSKSKEETDMLIQWYK